jgi:CRP-like cAMP-binding protein
MYDPDAARKHFSDSLTERYGFKAQPLVEDFLQRFFQPRLVAEKSHLISAGEVVRDVYFIHQGIFRVYYIDQNGNEVNQQFYQAGEVVAPVLSLHNEEPSPFYLQAMTPAQILVAGYPELHREGQDSALWMAAENAILKGVFLKTARREAQMLLGGAEQRYRWFLKENPQLAEQLPLYQIASYLGVTPVSLSRLRKKLNQ